ncbi:hypothetical protein MMPV_000144 [Pyropia vietnamensis]
MNTVALRYLQHASVRRWLLDPVPVKTVSVAHVESSFVYSLVLGKDVPDRAAPVVGADGGPLMPMDVEDLLVVHTTVDDIVLGSIFGLRAGHVFAATPLMGGRSPLCRRFAVDLSRQDALEFVEFAWFDDGRLLVMNRAFMHAAGGALPVAAEAVVVSPAVPGDVLASAAAILKAIDADCDAAVGSLRSSPVGAGATTEGDGGGQPEPHNLFRDSGPNLLGLGLTVVIKATLFESADCASCAALGAACRCDIDKRLVGLTKREVITNSWQHYVAQFMQKNRYGLVHVEYFALLPAGGADGIYKMQDVADRQTEILNILVSGTSRCAYIQRVWRTAIDRYGLVVDNFSVDLPLPWVDFSVSPSMLPCSGPRVERGTLPVPSAPLRHKVVRSREDMASGGGVLVSEDVHVFHRSLPALGICDRPTGVAARADAPEFGSAPDQEGATAAEEQHALELLELFEGPTPTVLTPPSAVPAPLFKRSRAPAPARPEPVPELGGASLLSSLSAVVPSEEVSSLALQDGSTARLDANGRVVRHARPTGQSTVRTSSRLGLLTGLSPMVLPDTILPLPSPLTVAPAGAGPAGSSATPPGTESLRDRPVAHGDTLGAYTHPGGPGGSAAGEATGYAPRLSPDVSHAPLPPPRPAGVGNLGTPPDRQPSQDGTQSAESVLDELLNARDDEVLRLLPAYRSPTASGSSTGVPSPGMHAPLSPLPPPQGSLSPPAYAEVAATAGEPAAAGHERDLPRETGGIDARPFRCSLCSATFKAKGDMQRHVVSIHEQRRPHACTQCTKSFSHRGHLNRHVQTVHLRQRKYGCEHCDLRFLQQAHLTTHVRMVHERLRPHTCTECDLSVTTSSALRKHQRTKHPHLTALLSLVDEPVERVGEKDMAGDRLLGAHVKGDARPSAGDGSAGTVGTFLPGSRVTDSCALVASPVLAARLPSPISRRAA